MPHKASDNTDNTDNTMAESKTTTVLNGDSPQSTTLRVRHQLLSETPTRVYLSICLGRDSPLTTPPHSTS